ncbi:MAG: type II toxin-antitoxin system PemK/MazF family toxin [Terracidiphilus sp.]
MVDDSIPEAGDLVWLDFDPQAGHEQAGRRPALVLSDWKFNQRTSLAFVCPITSKTKGYATEVALPAGLPVFGAVLCSHLRSLDWRVRNIGLIGKAPENVLVEVREIVGSIAGILP